MTKIVKNLRTGAMTTTENTNRPYVTLRAMSAKVSQKISALSKTLDDANPNLSYEGIEAELHVWGKLFDTLYVMLEHGDLYEHDAERAATYEQDCLQALRAYGVTLLTEFKDLGALSQPYTLSNVDQARYFGHRSGLMQAARFLASGHIWFPAA